MRILIRIISIVVAALTLATCAQADAEGYKNPLIHLELISDDVILPHNTINILLLGIDLGHRGYWGSGGKRTLEDCHTDTVMVIAVNLDEKRADFISLPRDTLTYVPGVKGIYKLNTAINCGKSIEDSLQKACDAVSWVLGGIKIDYYFAVDMNAMIVLGDAIGGVDFELEMSYKGHSGRKYYKGLRHLDGVGITDYMRARTNATVNANDIGRTGRQRELMMAILIKLKSDKDLLLNAFKTAKEMQDSFFTNITDAAATDFLPLLPVFLNLNEQSVGSNVITGKYRTALKGWNITFTDQDHRREVIRQVYGVEVPELKYVSYPYTKWLVDNGFAIVRYLSVAKRMREEISILDAASMSAEQKEMLEAFDSSYKKTQRAFDTAADTMAGSDTKAMASAGKELRKCGDALYKLVDGISKPVWANGQYWYADRMVNEVDVNFR